MLVIRIQAAEGAGEQDIARPVEDGPKGQVGLEARLVGVAEGVHGTVVDLTQENWHAPSAHCVKQAARRGRVADGHTVAFCSGTDQEPRGEVGRVRITMNV